MNYIASWKYKNITLASIGLAVGAFLFYYEPFHEFLLRFGTFGYLGAFVAGLLYDSTVTVTTAIVVLFVLVEGLHPYLLGFVAACGAVLGDYIIFRFVKNNLLAELQRISQPLVEGIGKRRMHYIRHLIHSKYFHWMLPVIGAVLIGSPFPNELAITIMGTIGIKTKQLLLLSFAVNFIGIMIIVTIANFVRS